MHFLHYFWLWMILIVFFSFKSKFLKKFLSPKMFFLFLALPSIIENKLIGNRKWFFGVTNSLIEPNQTKKVLKKRIITWNLFFCQCWYLIFLKRKKNITEDGETQTKKKRLKLTKKVNILEDMEFALELNSKKNINNQNNFEYHSYEQYLPRTIFFWGGGN